MFNTDAVLGFTHFKSPILQWQMMPTFLVGEYLFYFLTIIAFIHAIKSGPKHILIWWASVLTGTANDIFFIFLPVVDNFWQAQATVMLTARFPLYIACVYTCFMYYSIIAAWRIAKGPLATAALAGVLAYLFYAPYDIIGAKFLWWTWHQTDFAIHERLLGVPIGSSMWIMTFTSSFSLLLHWGLKKNYIKSYKTYFFTLLICFLFTTPLMLVQMTLIQMLDPQHTPTMFTFCVLFGLYLLIIVLGYFYKTKQALFLSKYNVKYDKMVSKAIIGYFALLCLLAILFKPEQHISTGIHQTYGPCDITGTDLAGHIRRIYFCKNDVDVNFIASPVKTYTSWYTIYGTPFADFFSWFSGMIFICSIGGLLFFVIYADSLNYLHRSSDLNFNSR